ncbi:hypothetical protein B0H14DRAFT_3442197 [Mycena olivaceomarginata]|nr:hypothetical protein B0H14DRAFT_3442197 [Mycena olivaceomarginata]
MTQPRKAEEAREPPANGSSAGPHDTPPRMAYNPGSLNTPAVWSPDYQPLLGSYRGSTWFEAAILRPSQAQGSTTSPFRLPSSGSNLNFNARSPSWLNRLGTSPVGLETTLRYDPVLEVANTAAHGEGGSRWKVQSNFCASNDHREHVVRWDTDGSLRALLPLSCLETGLQSSPE